MLGNARLRRRRRSTPLAHRTRRGRDRRVVAVDGVAVAAIAVADPIKATTAEAIRALHAEGLRIVMLTGDSRTTAEPSPRRSASTR